MKEPDKSINYAPSAPDVEALELKQPLHSGEVVFYLFPITTALSDSSGRNDPVGIPDD